MKAFIFSSINGFDGPFEVEEEEKANERAKALSLKIEGEIFEVCDEYGKKLGNSYVNGCKEV